MNRMLAIACGLLLLPVLLAVFYWFLHASELEAVVRANLAHAQERFSRQRPPLRLKYESVTIHGFPFFPTARIGNPSLSVDGDTRTLTLKTDYIDLVPETSDFGLLRVEMPLSAQAVDIYRGNEYRYALAVDVMPGLAFRTPARRQEDESSSSELIYRNNRKTSDLEKERFILMDEYAINIPREVMLKITYGAETREIRKRFLSLKAVRRWKPVPYGLGRAFDQFFALITKTVHYHSAHSATP